MLLGVREFYCYEALEFGSLNVSCCGEAIVVGSLIVRKPWSFEALVFVSVG